MKKFFLSCSLFMFTLVVVNAQCAKSASAGCCASKAKATTSADVKAVDNIVANAAEIAADADQNIQKRQNPETGELTFFQKAVCTESGKISWNKVSFDETSKTFTQVASVMMEKTAEGAKEVKKEASCEKGAAKACCSAKKESN